MALDILKPLIFRSRSLPSSIHLLPLLCSGMVESSTRRTRKRISKRSSKRKERRSKPVSTRSRDDPSSPPSYSVEENSRGEWVNSRLNVKWPHHVSNYEVNKHRYLKFDDVSDEGSDGKTSERISRSEKSKRSKKEKKERKKKDESKDSSQSKKSKKENNERKKNEESKDASEPKSSKRSKKEKKERKNKDESKDSSQSKKSKRSKKEKNDKKDRKKKDESKDASEPKNSKRSKKEKKEKKDRKKRDEPKDSSQSKSSKRSKKEKMDKKDESKDSSRSVHSNLSAEGPYISLSIGKEKEGDLQSGRTKRKSCTSKVLIPIQTSPQITKKAEGVFYSDDDGEKIDSIMFDTISEMMQYKRSEDILTRPTTRSKKHSAPDQKQNEEYNRYYVGVKSKKSVESNLKPGEFALYYEEPQEGEVPLSVNLNIAYLSSTSKPFHFPIQCFKGTDGLKHFVVMQNKSDGKMFTSILSLVKHYSQYSHVDTSTGRLETFSVPH